MKKLLPIIISLFMVFSLSACNGRDDDKKDNKSSNVTISENKSETSQIEHTGKKIEGTITAMSPFSEGLAFVKIEHKKEKTFCINKEGYIVFELDMELSDKNGEIKETFVNGLAVINPEAAEGTPRMLCDTKGYIATPEDIGVTDISGVALKGGYLIVERVTSGYNYAIRELGVMDTKLNWVVQPSASLHKELMDTYERDYEDDYVETFRKEINEYCCYFNDILLSNGDEYFNLKTGEISDEVDVTIPPDCWRVSYSWSSDGYQEFKYVIDKTGTDNTKLDLSHVENIYTANPDEMKFVGHMAPIAFYNEESRTFFFTLINEKYEFLFEPIEFKNITKLHFVFDGEYLLVKGYENDKNTIPNYICKCYNSKGNLVGEKAFSDMSNLSISDGVIVETGYNIYSTFNYYNTDFTELF